MTYWLLSQLVELQKKAHDLGICKPEGIRHVDQILRLDAVKPNEEPPLIDSLSAHYPKSFDKKKLAGWLGVHFS